LAELVDALGERSKAEFYYQKSADLGDFLLKNRFKASIKNKISAVNFKNPQNPTPFFAGIARRARAFQRSFHPLKALSTRHIGKK
jgi:hypothetical protein